MNRCRKISLILAAAAGLVGSARGAEPHVYQADGVKIGEVLTTEATVWTRLTRHADLNRQGVPFSKVNKHRAIHEGVADGQVPPGVKLEEMQDAVPGAAGEVRVTWSPEQAGAGGSEVASTAWTPVDPLHDFTHQFHLTGLVPGTWYRLLVESRGPDAVAGASVEGRFKTMPAPDTVAPVRFIVTTCHDDWRRDDPENGFKVYPTMRDWAPDFFIQTGDFVYLDKALPYAVTPALARFKWNRTSAWPFVRDFYRGVSAYFMKDDHDVLKNDSYPGETYGALTFDQGRAIELEQLPMPAQPPYRTLRWGRDVQLWLLEGREFRSPGDTPDHPGKTLLGAEQKRWLFDSMRASTAAFRLVISGDAIVGPDVDYKSGDKGDSLGNESFHTEGDEVRRFLGSLENALVISGDRHWQYHSIDPVTGLNEFGCGPMCFGMAEGFVGKVKRSPLHRFLRVDGGFLSVVCARDAGRPTLTVEYHDVQGKVLYQSVFHAIARNE